MTRRSVVVGIDKGTSSLKTIAVDLATGALVAERGAKTPCSYPSPGRHEENPEDTWRSVASTIRCVVGDLGPDTVIEGVGVTAHMGGLWTLGGDGRPVGNAICWPDARATGILDEVGDRGELDALFDISGNALIPGTPYPLLAWVKRHEPARYADIAHFFMAKDYINYRLTGIVATEESDLSFAPCDFRGRRKAEAFFTAFGIEEMSARLPDVGVSEALLGTVTDVAAAETGLPVGTPVCAGTGDATANMIGIGAAHDGQAVTTIGTSLMNGTSTDHPLLEPRGVGFAFLMPENRWQRQITNSGGGTMCLDWVINTFCPVEVERIAAGETTLGHVVREFAQDTEPGARGLVFHPYLNTAGATAPFLDVNARGSFVGLRRDTTPAEMVRAVMEGTALSVRDCYAAMPVRIDEIRLTGGGARSVEWSQIIADVLQKTIVAPDVPESGALGAAMLAAIATGQYTDLDAAAAQMVREGRVHEPDTTTAEVYDAAFSTYRAVLTPLRDVWAAVADGTDHRTPA
ncbi:FGGY-family carbohydrate kinase [Gordonia hankookensis]|uniref:Carbohydrate kinase n=1 Tax=Gordonia hankookensis TaxID=589403 RepID=A0ABR7WFM7_9ACTN|nr:FGGY family carbohydrate kinase [Gordonia hankookensis]MBD1321480.1 carbohydrate kinase [Gordonia hankookensis]